MALTIDSLVHVPVGDRYMVRGQIDFDSSYPTGGESLTAGNIGLRTIDLILFEQRSGLNFTYDYTGELMLVFEQGVRTGSTTVADATTGALLENHAAAETTFRAMGTAVDTTIILGPLREAAASTDLSAVTNIRFVAFGT